MYLVSQIISKTIPIHCQNKKAQVRSILKLFVDSHLLHQVYRVKYAVMCALKQRTKAVEDESPTISVVDLLQDFPTLLSTFECT